MPSKGENSAIGRERGIFVIAGGRLSQRSNLIRRERNQKKTVGRFSAFAVRDSNRLSVRRPGQVPSESGIKVTTDNLDADLCQPAFVPSGCGNQHKVASRTVYPAKKCN